MEIQDETPLPARPLEPLDEDYGFAVLHLAWNRNAAAETQERTLLFAFVELIPHEIPPPIDDYDPTSPRSSLRLGGGSKHCVYVRHAVVTARRALEWYLACRRGIAVLPNNDGSLPEPDEPKAKRLSLVELGEEPPWPTLISSSDESDTIPFRPHWVTCPRTHHLLPLADLGFDQLWSPDERAKAEHFLSDRLHFKLKDRPEYWGSIHLIAPNPVYRSMSARLGAGVAPTEPVLIRFEPRVGKSVEGLEIIVREKDPWGVTAFRRTVVRRPVVRLTFGRKVHGTREEVFDPWRGLLHVSDMASVFLRGFSVGVGLGRSARVQGPRTSYEVPRRGEVLSHVRTNPEHKVAPARSRLFGAHYKRKQQLDGARYDQRWFQGQKEEAHEFLRTLLNEAESEVLVVDPYFGVNELFEDVLAVGSDTVPVHILSSSDVLKTLKKTPDGNPIEEGQRLFDAVRRLPEEGYMNPFEVRVMPGERPAVHARFLVVDQRIWLLGASLNEFGSRGTMMVALPDPNAVRNELLKVWDESIPLARWLEQRHAVGQQQGGEAP